MSEWRQFRILIRVSLGRLLETAVASRGIDATQFAIWSLALVATPPFFFAARMMGKYGFMWRRPDVLERAALADRLFFIVYVMLASALLAAMLWDALFPDRQDQEIVGVLPVRPRTLAAARLTTALGVATLFSAALAVPSGFMYTLNVAAGYKSASILGWAPAVFLGHVVAVTAAGVFAFALLLALRGIAVACLGAEATQRAAAILQLITVVLLLEALIFLPGLLDGLVRELKVEASATALPPLWFMGVYAAMGGPPAARVPGLATLGLGATGAVLLLAVAAYIIPATWNTRRTLEAKLKNRTGRSVAIAQRVASPALRRPLARAVFAFTLASLTRSRRHALTMATYLGGAVAVSAIRFMVAAVRNRPVPLEAPADYLLAVPLLFTFFLVAGLRSAFSVPTHVEGNWTFRVAQPRSTPQCVHGLSVALVFLAVLPVTLAWLLVTLSLWHWWPAVAAAAMHAASGVALVELAIVGCRSIPFTRAHAAATDAVRTGWIFVAIALHAYAFGLSEIQLVAIGSPWGVALYCAGMMAVAIGARAFRRSRPATGLLEFDAPSTEAMATLNLSQATG